ncbi:DNA repair protein RadC [Geomicrobium sp. JCM 19055]|uniref:RadC family protein n=1 Tax=Geomicrobium sp. JCM 19055 TaxID=1460649 RepID=UPI0005A9BB43|nr:DNA repair protein RadC [Geomicrobium sp. JCM 19055]
MNMPNDERPRERLLLEGADKLSNVELLAILLRTGSRQESVIELSQRILTAFGGLLPLKEATLEELQAIKGIGRVKAIEIRAVLELGKRIHTTSDKSRVIISSPNDAVDLVMEDLRFLKQEHFVAIYLNTKNQVIHKQTLFIGSLNSSIVHPREVFKEAIRRSAASVIALHNHPSGDPEPSEEDKAVTRRLFECGQLLGIELLDHIVIGDHKYVSLRELEVI